MAVPSVPEEISDLPYGHLLRPHRGGLANDGSYDTVHFDGLSYENENAAGAAFLECAFSTVSLTDCRLRRARFNEVWVQGSRWVAVDLAESDWQDSTVLGGVLAGITAYGSALRRVVFRQCRIESVNLRGAELRDVVFEDCVLRDVDLSSARLTGLSFPGSTLESVRLAAARLSRVDLRGATRLDLADGYEALRGATLNTGQVLELAPQLAQALGIVVKDR